MRKTLVLGASSYYEIYDLVNDINQSLLKEDKIEIIGLLDDNKDLKGKNILGAIVLGKLKDYHKFSEPDTLFIFGIGSHKNHLLRREIILNLGIENEKFLTLIHPTVKVFSSSKIGYGCIIHFGTIIFNNTVIGRFNIIMALAVIGANNIIGDGCLITSKVSTTNGVKIGSYSFLGTLTAVSENVEIAPGSKISMCSFVRNNSKPGEFVFSNPSKSVKMNLIDNEIIKDWNEFKSRR